MNFPGFSTPIHSKPLSSFFESLIFSIETLKIDNVPTTHKLLRQNIMNLLENSMLKHSLSLSLPEGHTWSTFLKKFGATNTGLDPFGILIHVSAHFLERNICIISDKKEIKTISGGPKATKKPQIWLFRELTNGIEVFSPVLQHKATKDYAFNSFSRVENDLKYMAKEDIYTRLQSYVNSAKKPEMSAKVIGYMSKVIPEAEREQSIWRKEAMALINGLAKFKPLIEISPAVLCLVDSQVVYFLSHNNLLSTNLKAKRLGTLLHLEYPNIIIMAIKGTANVSDKMSRLFSLPKVIQESISLKNLRIEKEIPEIEGKAFSIPEARREVSKLNRHSITKTETEDKNKENRGNSKKDQEIEAYIQAISAEDAENLGDPKPPYTSLTKAEKTLLENINPIRILSHRLKREKIIELQENLPLYDELRDKEKQNNGVYELNDGLIRLIEGKQVLIPEKLEGVVLSYAHLICGHTGWTRLYAYVRQKYFFPELKEKCKNIATTCHICYVSNPSTHRKTPVHSVIASYPLEIVTADLLEVEAIQGKKQHKILVICDYFSKVIWTFDLKSFTGSAFLDKFKEFLSCTGMVTKIIIVDNATIFSNAEVLTFLHLVGIRKVKGNANHSQSRGLVESTIRILQTLLRKLLALSSKYNYEDLLFLAPVLLNRSVNRITGMSPYEMLYGRDLTNSGPIGTNIDPPDYRLFNESVKDDLKRLREKMVERIDQVSEKIAEQKEKYLQKENQGRKEKDNIRPGTIVFLKNYSVPKSGRARKFRTRYLKSPQVVLSSSPTSVVTLRLADSFVSRHHPDAMLVYKGDTKDPALHDDLPSSVLDFLGRPMSSETLLKLAEEDELELIYEDIVLPEMEKVITRSETKKAQEREKALELARLAADAEDEDEDELLDHPVSIPFKKVKFADLDSEEE